MLGRSSWAVQARTFAAGALLLVSGCSSSGHGDQRPLPTVHGLALAAPTCEVELESSPCPPAPVAHDRVVAVADGGTVASTKTDGSGRFVLRLPAGRYVIRLADVGGYADTGSTTVVVGKRQDMSVRLDVRTGVGG